MANIYQSIKSHFTPEVVSKISALLGENNDQVKSGVGLAIPSLLAGFLEKGNTGKIKNILEETYKKNVFLEKDGIFTDKGHEKLALGEKFLTEASGGHESALTSLISSEETMSSSNSKKLLAMVGTVVAGFLSKRLNANGNNMDRVLDEVNSERSAILSDLPADFRNRLKIAERREIPKAAPAAAPKKKDNMGWLWTVLGIIILLLLLWWGMRSCNSCRRVTTPPVVTQVVDTVKKIVEREKFELALPDGRMITVFRGGMEDLMITFLNSDVYKTGGDAEMKNHWFEFDNLSFEYNSGTQLTEGSRVQVDNLVAIMTHYPDARIRIAGNADVKGRPKVNMVISEQRANTIKQMMVDAGIAENRITTRGFGEERATIPASATDAERAPDRDISIRFMK